MRPVSDAFLRTLRGSHTMCVEARAVTPGQSGVDPDGVTIPIIGGDVRMDGSADIWGTLDLTTDGTDMWPTGASSPLAPYGQEIWVRRGIDYGAGRREWVSLGYYRIQSPDQDDAPDGPIRIVGRDRMAGLIDSRLLAPRQWDQTYTYGEVVTDLVTEVYPAAGIEWDDDTDTVQLGRQVIAEQDRHAFLAELVTSRGKIWYWDHRGVLVIQDPPDPSTPVWDVDSGEGGVLVQLGRQLTRDGVYNAVVATGEAADTETPARAVAIDDNPQSPTYFYGQFGPVPREYSSPFLTTDGQALSAARSLLLRALGLPYSVDFSAVPNPALVPYDPVRVRYSTRHGAETHVIESLTIPLTVEAAMTAATREQTRVLIGSV